jgi:hypothetical protein
MIAVPTLLAVSGGLQAGASLLSGIKGFMGSNDEQDAIRAEIIRRRALASIQGKLEQKDFEFEQAIADQATAYNKGMVQREGAQVVGSQRAAFGASGVDVSAGGSPAAAMLETSKVIERDSRMLTYNNMVQRLRSQRQVDLNAVALRLGVQSELAALSRQRDAAGKAATGSLLSGAVKAGTSALGAYTSAEDYKSRMGKK